MNKSDIKVRDEGSIIILTPNSMIGLGWCEENIPGAMILGGLGRVVEHRYIQDIYDGMVLDGLILEED